MQIFDVEYYGELDGGIVEALGRFLSQNVKLYVLAMPAEEVRARLAASGSDPADWEYPSEGVISHQDVCPTTPAKHLFRYVVETGALIAL